MKKRVLSFILCICLAVSLLTVMTSAAAAVFADVKSSDYFATSVNWAVDKGITVGTSSTAFSPNSTCTRAQILTFMWRAAGSPEPDPKIVNFYVDIKESDYFYKASLWAREKGVHVPSDEYFRPDTPCTRASTVEYFWRLAGAEIGNIVPFSDIDHGSTLENAVSWAVTNGITAGTGGTAFTPDTVCTRAQIVTFLYRYYVAPIDNSALIETLKETVPVTALKLDPLPPEDYLKQPDWYGHLTSPADMTDERLMAELKQIRDVMADFRARDIYIGDAIYARELDLHSQASRRGLE
ncbi:MAG: S-layer homology domain-containing protein [Clostridia bacterium]|nr:S-layer homology domain-containing protein [Clostridia bacterium]